MRKRAWLAAAAGVCLVTASAAAAKSGDYSGTLNGVPSSAVALSAKLNKKGKPTKVTRIQWSGLTLQCSNGATAPGSGQIQVSGKSWKVKRNGKFRVRFKRKDATGHVFAKYDVDGEFSANRKKVTGTIVHKQDGFGGPAVQCESSAAYSATKR